MTANSLNLPPSPDTIARQAAEATLPNTMTEKNQAALFKAVAAHPEVAEAAIKAMQQHPESYESVPGKAMHANVDNAVQLLRDDLTADAIIKHAVKAPNKENIATFALVAVDHRAAEIAIQVIQNNPELYNKLGSPADLNNAKQLIKNDLNIERFDTLPKDSYISGAAKDATAKDSNANVGRQRLHELVLANPQLATEAIRAINHQLEQVSYTLPSPDISPEPQNRPTSGALRSQEEAITQELAITGGIPVEAHGKKLPTPVSKKEKGKASPLP